MLWLTCSALLAALALSCLSRSALTWCAFLVLMMLGSRALALNDLYPYLCVLDTAVLFMMLSKRQRANQAWQEPVIVLQCGILLLYVAFIALGKNMLWLTVPFIDAANIAFLAQVALVGLGGLSNSKRNYHYAKSRKRKGDKTSFLILAWRAI